MDWSATMLELGGATSHPDYPLDGVSLVPVLRNPAHTFARPMYWRMKHRGQRALRDGDWKYLMVDGNEYLFDIRTDARERANRAKREPERLARMRQAWIEWHTEIGAIPDDALVTLGYGPKDFPAR
jgi:arylsulfatase A-like enzyme